MTTTTTECPDCDGEGCQECGFTGEITVDRDGLGERHPRTLVDVMSEALDVPPELIAHDPEPAKDPAADLHLFKEPLLCSACDHPSHQHPWEEEPDTGHTYNGCTVPGCRCEEFVPPPPPDDDPTMIDTSGLEWVGDPVVAGPSASGYMSAAAVRRSLGLPPLCDGKIEIGGRVGRCTQVAGHGGPCTYSPTADELRHPTIPRTPHPEDEVNAVAGWARTWADDPDNRRESLRRYALACVDLRQCFSICHDGTHVDPDWRCRSFDCRDSMSEAKHRSGISEDDWKKLTGNARYHVSAIVRKRASDDELARAGLSPLTARERVKGGRSTRTADYENDLLVILADLARAALDYMPSNPVPLLGEDHPLIEALARASTHLPPGMLPGFTEPS